MNTPPPETNEEHEEKIAAQTLTTRQWNVYDLTRQGYTLREIAAQLGYGTTTMHRELHRALTLIANTLEQQDEGPANTNLATKRRWQGNDVAFLPNETLTEAIYREQQRLLRPTP